ncbi:MAG: class I SAM-dependent methyltransferase, partial [candidate division KSB1 bacterium]|nr:class I SAM-dependent methyltransferase [candidate division KSB1 bacterium]
DSNDPLLVSILDDLPLWSAPFGLRLLDSVLMKPKMNVLDLGCGAGFPLIELANRMGASCQIYGIDPWFAALKRAQLKAHGQALSNVALIQALGEHLPFPALFFHLIVSNNGINNVSDPEAVLAECARVSQPHAQFILTVNLPGTMKEFYQIFEQTLSEMGKRREIDEMHKHIHEKRRPLHQTLKMITTAGFRIKKIHEDHFSMSFLDGSAMFGHFFIKLAFLESWEKILSPEDRKPVFEIVEQKLNRIAHMNGALHLTIPYVCIVCRKM